MTIHRIPARWFAAAAFALCAVTGRGADADAARTGDDPIAFLLARNIFDPGRAAPRARDAAPPPPRVEPPPVRTLALTGSLVYPGKTIAIFSGSEPAFNGVVAPEESIGPWTVRDITTRSAELAGDEQVFTLPVGRQLTQVGDQPWAIADLAAARPATPTSTTPQETTPPAAGGADDVMKRMLERRQKELSQ
jgi:hypothetical protein